MASSEDQTKFAELILADHALGEFLNEGAHAPGAAISADPCIRS